MAHSSQITIAGVAILRYLCQRQSDLTEQRDMEFNFTGIIIGVATFLIIGLFHPLVIKSEYYFGVRCWWVFLLAGIVSVVASLCIADVLWSTLIAVFGASSFWSIGELFQQRKRVERGWFPKRKQ